MIGKRKPIGRSSLRVDISISIDIRIRVNVCNPWLMGNEEKNSPYRIFTGKSSRRVVESKPSRVYAAVRRNSGRDVGVAVGVGDVTRSYRSPVASFSLPQKV